MSQLARAVRNPKYSLTAEAIVADYRLAFSSRRASIIGRAEVLRGNATFGIFGDGKEVAQIAMAKAFRPGDWRAGYYRDQTFMWATRMSNVREFFAQLYGNANLESEPASGGRQMGNHFATRFLDAFSQVIRAPRAVAVLRTDHPFICALSFFEAPDRGQRHGRLDVVPRVGVAAGEPGDHAARQLHGGDRIDGGGHFRRGEKGHGVFRR